MKTVLWCIVALYAICQANATEIWKTEGFENFRMGTVGNAGQNIYISKSGLLQRIHHSDINLDGEVDLLFCNSQGHEEYVHPVAYKDVLRDPSQQIELRLGGVSSAIAVGDLNGDGYDEVVFACGWNGSSWIPNNMIFYGSPEGISNRYNHYLTVTRGRPAIGDFNGDKLPDVIFVYGNADKGKFILCSNSKAGMQSEGKTREFSAHEMQMPGNYIAGVIAVPDIGGDALVVRMNNGGMNIFRNLTGQLELTQEILLEPDPDYTEEKNLLKNNQFVPDPKPLLRILKINGKIFIFGAYKKSCALYLRLSPRLDNFYEKIGVKTLELLYPIVCRLQVPK